MPITSGLEEVGVAAVVDGAGEFLAQMKAMEKAYDSLTDAIAKGTKATDALGAAAGGPTTAMVAIGTAAGQLAVKLGTVLVGAIKDVGAALFDLGKGALMMASDFNLARLATLAIGRRMGLTKDEILDNINAVNELGIRYDVAARTIGQFARFQINLADATKLVSIAQGIGIERNIGSTEAMNRLTTAIATGVSARFAFLGLTVKKTVAEEIYANVLGKSAEALTDVERKQALVNEVIRQGAPLVDVYSAAMQTAGKQIGTFRTRLVGELLAALGAPFQKAFFTVTLAINELTIAFTEAISEGGKLFPIMVQLGAVASILADGFRSAVDVVIKFIAELDENVNQGLSNIAESALRWGVNIVASLANGMASAIRGFLIPVINAISRVLSFFFRPGSPPRIAPDIDEWGAQTMEEYLRGFTEADFGVLEKVQSILKSVLTGPQFAELSETLIRGLGGAGIPGGFFTAIAQQAGEFGEEIALLTRLQIDYAAATEDAAQAQADLERSQRMLSRSQADISKATREFNDLLREGASPELLAAKKAEIEAAEERFSIAQDEARIADQELQDAKDREDALKTQTTLQEKLVKQLLALADARDEATGGGAGGGAGPAGGVGDLLEGLELPTAADFDFTDSLSEAIESAKAAILAKFTGEGGIFTPLIKAWKKDLEPALSDLLGAFFTPFRGAPEEVFGFEDAGFGATAFDGLIEAFEGVVTWLTVTLPEAVIEFRTAFTTGMNDILQKISPILANIKKRFDPILILAMEKVAGVVEGPLGDAFFQWNKLKASVTLRLVKDIRRAFEDLSPAFGTIAAKLIIGGSLFEAFSDFIEFELVIFLAKADLIKGALERIVELLVEINLLSVNPFPGLPGEGTGGEGESGAGRVAPGIPSLPAVPIPSLVPSTTVVQVSVGDINNGMDVATLEAVIVQTVERAVGR